jgi:acyl CoA:acetate/3-ketoacid CoA transferase
MRLEKIVFCGKFFGPTSNYQVVDERLAIRSSFPLSKYLLGAMYNLLHQQLACQPTPQ